jgi:N utilization substance protein A
MTIELTNDDLKAIALFESITGAQVADIHIGEGTVAFTVGEGDLGKAIGKKGANITRVRQAFGRQVLVFEESEDISQFIKNLFGQVPIRNINIHEKMNTKTAYVTVDGKDRGSAIGRGGDRIKVVRALLLRKFNCDLSLKS